jgi:hypothetical protein
LFDQARQQAAAGINFFRGRFGDHAQFAALQVGQEKGRDAGAWIASTDPHQFQQVINQQRSLHAGQLGDHRLAALFPLPQVLHAGDQARTAGAPEPQRWRHGPLASDFPRQQLARAADHVVDERRLAAAIGSDQQPTGALLD